jgi:post-segregation antitoxin (ccd killing protein)
VKPNDQKNDFIRLRAEGKSYTAIGKELNISKATCTAWEKELKAEIADKKKEQLEEMYEAYYMTREARITKLGQTLESIEDALSQVDLTQVSPEKLLDYKLKYMEALKQEFIDTTPAIPLDDSFNPRDIIVVLADLLKRIRNRETNMDQASRETMVIANILKAYETVELKAKLETIEGIIGSRE